MKASPPLRLSLLASALLTASTVLAQNPGPMPGRPAPATPKPVGSMPPLPPLPPLPPTGGTNQPPQPPPQGDLPPPPPDPNDNSGKVPAQRPKHKLNGPAPRPAGHLGDPLPGLTTDQLNDFVAGLAEFQAVETPESGLGPIFNNTSCAICHSAPAIGGSSATLVTRFGTMNGGHFDPLAALGGSLLQSQAIDPAALEKVPAEATIVVHRQSTPLFGAGLIEAIPDATIQALAQQRKPDGVVGRPAMITDVVSGQTRVGRYGWKAQQATLLAFAGDAYLNEMGITNRFFPTENAPNGDLALLAQFDKVADPEDVVDPFTGKSDIDAAADFMRLLAPPAPPRPSGTTQMGMNVFNQLGCAVCHVPVLMTGPSKIHALDRKPVWLFSDLLLHDMGSLNDEIEQAGALGNEMKTAPLWGLKFSAPYLHDGRAPTIADAIRGHDGEGAASRDRFNKLTTSQQRELLNFLNTL